MKKRLLSLFSLALTATTLLAQTTELPDLTLCSTAQSVNLVIGGSVDDTTMKIDRGDGILNEYPLIADEATAITLSPVDAETPIKIYGVADRMNYFRAESAGLTDLKLTDTPQLKWLLVGRNSLTAIDVTGCPELVHIECPENNISKLDISKNTKLTTLISASNPNLGTVNFSSCPEMLYIDMHNCPKVYSANVSMLPKLYYLSVETTGLSSIDVSKNAELKTLNCGYSRISRLDVSHNTKLQELYYSTKSTGTRATSIDLSNNPELTVIFVDNQKLTNLDLSNNPKVESLFCAGNELPALDLTNNTSLALVSCYSNRMTFTSIPSPAERPEFQLYWYAPQKDIILNDIEYGIGSTIDLTSSTIRQDNDTEYKLYLTDILDPYTTKELKEGTDFSVDKGVIKLLKAQTDSVYISAKNPAFPGLELKTTKFMVLDEASLGQNNLAFEYTHSKEIGESCSLSLSAYKAGSKIYVDFGDGELKEFTVNASISNYGPKITGTLAGKTIKVYTHKGVQIKEIRMPSSNITDINVYNAHALQILNLSKNELTKLDLTGNRRLDQLTVDDNQLTELILPKFSLMTSLSCVRNSFENLDIANCTALKTLKFSNNKLKEINLDSNSSLTSIEANDNELESLNVDACLELTDLRLNDNDLSSLRLDLNPNLDILWISGNKFTFSTMPKTCATKITYRGQQKVEIAKASGVVDLSSEAMIGDVATIFTWKSADGTRLFEDEDYTISNGVTEFINTDFDAISCEMTNSAWPDLTLSTTEIKPLGKPDKLIATLTSKETAGKALTLTMAAYGPDYVFVDFGDGKMLPRKLDYNFTQYKANLGENREIKLYTYEESPVKMRVLSMIDHALKSVDISQLNDLECLNFSGDYLTTLDISKNLSLKELTLNQNRIADIDLSKHTALTLLSLRSMNLESIDLTELANLEWLSVADNKLSEINLSNKPKLRWLGLSLNNFSEIDLSGLTSLTEIYADNNKLTTINLDDQPDMAVVRLNDNKFRFSTFPEHNINRLYYTPQGEMEVVPDGLTVDLGSEATIYGNETTYVWTTISGSTLTENVDYTITDGVTTFAAPQTEQVICELSNVAFPDLVLRTVPMTIVKSGIAAAGNDTDFEFAIYNISGYSVASGDSNEYDSAVSTLIPGIYIVEINRNGVVSSEKLYIR